MACKEASGWFSAKKFQIIENVAKEQWETYSSPLLSFFTTRQQKQTLRHCLDQLIKNSQATHCLKYKINILSGSAESNKLFAVSRTSFCDINGFSRWAIKNAGYNRYWTFRANTDHFVCMNLRLKNTLYQLSTVLSHKMQTLHKLM